MFLGLAALVLIGGQRVPQPATNSVVPTTDDWSSFVRRDPNAVRMVLRQMQSRAIPKVKLSGLASTAALDKLADQAVKSRAGTAFNVDRGLLAQRDIATEGARDFGSLSVENSPTTAVTGTTWKAGPVSANLASEGKPSPFKLEYLTITYWKSGFGDTNRSEKSKAPFTSKAEEGDSYLVSVRVDLQNIAPGTYNDTLKITTPEATRFIPLKVTVLGTKQSVVVTEVMTPNVTFAAGETHNVRFKLRNTGTVNFPYTAQFEGAWNGLKGTTATGILVPGQTEVVEVPISTGPTTTDGSAGLAINLSNSSTKAPVGKVIFSANIKTIWKTWTYPLETLSGKVKFNATVSVASSGIWLWRFNLRDTSVVTPDAHETAFCFQNPIGGKRLGYYFKAYTKPGQSIGLVYSGVDARLQDSFAGLGNMKVILNSWDTVTSDPFFKIIEYAAIANLTGPGGLVAMALDPIKDPTKSFSDWTSSNNTAWLKLTGADVQ